MIAAGYLSINQLLNKKRPLVAGRGADFVTFMQHGPRKGVSKAISRRLGVEHPRREGMVRCVNGRFPVADGSEASFAGANRQHPGKSGIGC